MDAPEEGRGRVLLGRRVRRGQYHRQLLHDAVQGRLGRGRAGRAAPARSGGRDGRLRRGVLRRADLPARVKEAALFNLSTLRTQTCFRTADGRFYGLEGCGDKAAAATARARTYGTTSRRRRFCSAAWPRGCARSSSPRPRTSNGLMSFRVNLPLDRSRRSSARRAADGQMGCIMKMYRDWQLSGDDEMLKTLWPQVEEGGRVLLDSRRLGRRQRRRHGGLPAQHDGRGVLRPEPADGQLVPRGAAGRRGDGPLRGRERVRRRRAGDLFESGSRWIDANLFNGEYYEHQVRPPKDASAIAAGLLVGMGAKDLADPDYQLGAGCLVDQLVGQYMATSAGPGVSRWTRSTCGRRWRAS